MPKLKPIATPKGRPDGPAYVQDETGQKFAIVTETRTAGDGAPAVAILVGPIDGDAAVAGIDFVTHTHTFTPEELSAPDFDAEARIAHLVDEMVERNRTAIANRDQVAGVLDKLKAGKLDLAKRLPVAPLEADADPR